MTTKRTSKKGAASAASTPSAERCRELAAEMRGCARESVELAQSAPTLDEAERHYLRAHMEENIAKGYENSARKKAGGSAKAANHAGERAERERQVNEAFDSLIAAGRSASSVASIVAQRLGLSASQVRRIRGKARAC